jgi:predicted phage terminase large subunit-like protein
MNRWRLDDLISNELAENARRGLFTEIEKAKGWMNRMEPLCDGSDTPVCLLGTSWWQGDVYDYAEIVWGWEEPKTRIKWVCHLPDGTTQTHILERQGEMATFRRPVIEDGRSSFPELWPMERIDRVRRVDPQLFAANMMLNPSSDIVRDFKDGWLKYYEWTVPGKEVRYRDNNGEWRTVRTHEFDTVMAVDPAISEAARADRSAIIVSGSIDGIHHLILDVRAERLGVLDLCTFIEELQRQHRCRRIYVESVAYQRALSQLLASKGLPIIEVKPGSNKTKEMRIRSLEPYFRQGHVYVHQRQHEFFTEYEHFPRGQHDDVLDAMSYLTDEWSKIIGRNPRTDEIRKEYDRQQLEKLKNWNRPAREAHSQTRTEVGPAPKYRR